MENFTFLLQTLMAYALTDTGLLIVGVSCLTVALIGLAFVSRVSSRSTNEASYVAPPANTRRQDLEAYMNGVITIDQYLERQSGKPEDGSRKVEQARRPTSIKVNFEKVYPITLECSPIAHPGRRVRATRVQFYDGRPRIYQPKSRMWLTPETWDIVSHPCCSDQYRWIREVNGKDLL